MSEENKQQAMLSPSSTDGSWTKSPLAWVNPEEWKNIPFCIVDTSK